MSFTLKRGLSNVFVAEVTTDDNEENGGYKTGTPYHLIPAGEMTRTVENDKANVYYDNVVFYQSGMEGATEVTITLPILRSCLQSMSMKLQAQCLILANTRKSISRLAARRKTPTARRNTSGS